MVSFEDFISTPRGLTLRGASPALLDELLGEYTAVMRSSGYDLEELLRPGRSRDEIVDAWAERGIDVPEEAVRLWMWHDGSHPGVFPGAFQDSLASSLHHYDQVDHGFEDWEWHPEWITIWSDGGVAMSTAESDAPLLRDSDGAFGSAWWDERVQVISACTPIAMAIWGRSGGLYPINSGGIPDGSTSRWPEELRISLLYGW